MNLPLFIAGRYLFARKSHNVINIISAISAVGMAIGTAALIVILSVYNGFDKLIKDSLNGIDPDILVVPAEGKMFSVDSTLIAKLKADARIGSVSLCLQDNVFINYDGEQSVASAKGVDEVFEESTPLREEVTAGNFSLHRGDVPQCAVSADLSYKMDINPRFVTPLDLYFPDREGNISLTNPAASIKRIRIFPSCVFRTNQSQTGSLIILQLDKMRELTGYTNEISSIEIRTVAGQKETSCLIGELQESLGDAFKVKDRFRQNESLYKMMRYEKAAIFLILIFVIIIVAFNIFGSLSMLIIDKKEDIATLYSMGATGRTIRRTFILEGWLISLIGLVAGLVVGITFSLLQQKFGFITVPGNAIISAYPVMIKGSDIIVTALGVAIIGYLISILPARTSDPRTEA